MYVDADILYALLKPSDRYLEFAKKIVDSTDNLYTSVVSFIEVEFVVKRELNDFLAENVLEALLQKIPRLKIVPFNRDILQKSLELQQEFGVSVFDSIHAATALVKDKRIASTDHAYDRIPRLKRIKLS